MLTLSNAPAGRQATPARPPISRRGVRGRLRILRDYVRGCATSWLLLHHTACVGIDGWLILRGVPMECLECRAYRDLARLVGEKRVTLFVSRVIGRTLEARCA